MAEVLALRLLGVRADVTTTDASLADALASAWTDCRDDRGPADTAVSIDPGEWGVDAETALEVASQLLVIEAVGAQAGSLLMLHAAVVADPDSGAATLLVGPSGRGKTTAAQALAGSRIYVSDETAGVTERGRVLAFPKPLSVKGSGAAKRQVPASSLGRVAAVDEDFPVGAVLLLERDPARPPGPSRRPARRAHLLPRRASPAAATDRGAVGAGRWPAPRPVRRGGRPRSLVEERA